MVKHKSLAEERPDLLKEWDYEENDKLGKLLLVAVVVVVVVQFVQVIEFLKDLMT